MPELKWARRWFALLYGLVLLMVLLGGATRLTGSGLSIVDWRPVTGIVPPLSEADWEAEFAKYRGSTEFRQKNPSMQLAGFRQIFLWEYTHRLVGRILGLLLLLPLAVLLLSRRGSSWLRWRASLLTALVAAQGLMGWLMVKSGLGARPEVSHFRLAAHLMLAVATLLFLGHCWLSAGNRDLRLRNAGSFALGLGALLTLQLVYGAFLAGTKAGWLYASFPDFNGQWFPDGALALEPRALNLVENGAFIHWLHRVLAVFIMIALAWNLHRERASASARPAWVLAALGALQFGLGVATVVLQVPVWLGVLHQFVAILLVSAWLFWALSQPQANPNQAQPMRGSWNQ